MRLIYRDKGCVVCQATAAPTPYKSREDLIVLEGAHIVPMVSWQFVSLSVDRPIGLSIIHSQWDIHAFKLRMTDPYTDSANVGDPLASPTTRSGTDGRRMNSLDNGLLLCVNHHRRYDSFQFSIHPAVIA